MKYPMTKNELMDWAADNYTIEPNSEGNKDEALMSGWCNAMDVQDERKGNISDEDFINLSYHEFRNMGYEQIFEGIDCLDGVPHQE